MLFRSNWLVILIVGAILGYDIYLIVTRQWTKLQKQAYALMLAAEKAFSKGEGKKKFDTVFQRLYYDLVPPWLRVFVPPDVMRGKLQVWYNAVKGYLSGPAEEKPG